MPVKRVVPNPITRCWSTGATKDVSIGESGNPILVILQSPGESEEDLRRPATGHTGANLCRLFSFIGKGCKTQGDYCLRKITIINSTCDDAQLPDLTEKVTVFCIGEKAVRWYRGHLKKLPAQHSAFSFCHLGSRGLRRIKSSTGSVLSEREILKMWAIYIRENTDNFERYEKLSFFSLQDYLVTYGYQWMNGDKHVGTPQWATDSFISSKKPNRVDVMRKA